MNPHPTSITAAISDATDQEQEAINQENGL
jgi:hypothetical protein